MKITGYGSIATTSGLKKRGDVPQAGDFSSLLGAAEAEEASCASAAGEVAATSALSNLLALQELSEEDAHRRKLVQKGKSARRPGAPAPANADRHAAGIGFASPKP